MTLGYIQWNPVINTLGAAENYYINRIIKVTGLTIFLLYCASNMYSMHLEQIESINWVKLR